MTAPHRSAAITTQDVIDHLDLTVTVTRRNPDDITSPIPVGTEELTPGHLHGVRRVISYLVRNRGVGTGFATITRFELKRRERSRSITLFAVLNYSAGGCLYAVCTMLIGPRGGLYAKKASGREALRHSITRP